jgi:hypothetical protein
VFCARTGAEVLRHDPHTLSAGHQNRRGRPGKAAEAVRRCVREWGAAKATAGRDITYIVNRQGRLAKTLGSRPSCTTATQPQRERHWVQNEGMRVSLDI